MCSSHWRKPLDFGRPRLSGPSSLLPCTWQTLTRNLAGALEVFLFAIFACLTLRRTGALWFAIGFHAAGDYAETFLFSVRDSGYAASWIFLNSSPSARVVDRRKSRSGSQRVLDAGAMRRNVLFSLFVSASWSPGIATTGIACASETISRIALREQAWVLKKYVAFREWRFAARQAFLLLTYYHASAPPIANDSDFFNPHEIYRQPNRIRRCRKRSLRDWTHALVQSSVKAG
jgi:hypothetical protein